MYVEGRVLSTKGEPIANAIIDTWETDGFGQYDIQVMSPLNCDSTFSESISTSTMIVSNQSAADACARVRMERMPSVRSCKPYLLLAYLRAILTSILSPVPYGIPDDGPVAGLVEKLGRHIIRPAHLHIKIQVGAMS